MTNRVTYYIFTDFLISLFYLKKSKFKTASGNPAPNVMWLWKEPRQSRAVSKRFINDTELNGTLVYTQPDNTLHIENVQYQTYYRHYCLL